MFWRHLCGACSVHIGVNLQRGNLNRNFYRNTWTKPILGWSWEIWKCRCILVPFTVSKSACFCTYNILQGVKFRSSVLPEAGGTMCKRSAKVNWIFLTAWKDLIASPSGTFFYSVSSWEGLAQSKCWSMDLGKVLIAVSCFKLYYTLVKRLNFNATKLSLFENLRGSSPRCFLCFEGYSEDKGTWYWWLLRQKHCLYTKLLNLP